jgi:hypothetical protein
VSVNIPVSFPDEDAAEIRQLAAENGLAQQDVIRQSSRLGRPLLRERLSGVRKGAKGLLAFLQEQEVSFEPVQRHTLPGK